MVIIVAIIILLVIITEVKNKYLVLKKCLICSHFEIWTPNLLNFPFSLELQCALLGNLVLLIYALESEDRV